MSNLDIKELKLGIYEKENIVHWISDLPETLAYDGEDLFDQADYHAVGYGHHLPVMGTLLNNDVIIGSTWAISPWKLPENSYYKTKHEIIIYYDNVKLLFKIERETLVYKENYYFVSLQQAGEEIKQSAIWKEWKNV